MEKFESGISKNNPLKMMDIIQKELESYDLVFDENKKQQLLSYYELLIEKNKVMNLTALTEFQDVLYRHFLDSLYICKAISMKEIQTLIDVGTGAGFPGLPIKIVYPHIQVTLLDSLNKRVHFLNEVIEKLGLTGIQAIHSRAEEAGRNKTYREQYDVCTSRAVSRLCTLSEYCLPFVRKNGSFVSWKSASCDEEVMEAKKAIQLLGGEIREKVTYQFTENDEEYHRILIVIQKTKNTSAKYPRKAGLAQKEPLSSRKEL